MTFRSSSKVSFEDARIVLPKLKACVRGIRLVDRRLLCYYHRYASSALFVPRESTEISILRGLSDELHRLLNPSNDSIDPYNIILTEDLQRSN